MILEVCAGFIAGFISRPGVMRGHGKTPLFMAGMKCLPLCKDLSLPTTKELLCD